MPKFFKPPKYRTEPKLHPTGMAVFRVWFNGHLTRNFTLEEIEDRFAPMKHWKNLYWDTTLRIAWDKGKLGDLMRWKDHKQWLSEYGKWKKRRIKEIHRNHGLEVARISEVRKLRNMVNRPMASTDLEIWKWRLEAGPDRVGKSPNTRAKAARAKIGGQPATQRGFELRLNSLFNIHVKHNEAIDIFAVMHRERNTVRHVRVAWRTAKLGSYFRRHAPDQFFAAYVEWRIAASTSLKT